MDEESAEDKIVEVDRPIVSRVLEAEEELSISVSLGQHGKCVFICTREAHLT